MREITISGAEIGTREALHDVLQEKLALPDWYGRNLDALYDCLTAELTEETQLTVTDAELLEEALGSYGRVFLRVLEEAAEENPRLHIQ